MKFILFSMRNFERDGGGSIRMYGLLNALVEEGNEVIFISNAQNYTKFHCNIKHIYINHIFKGKSKFQGLTAIFPAKIVFKIYHKLFSQIEKALQCANLKNDQSSKLIFCEYLDNTIAYILKKNNVIDSYINDLHGIATIEFKYQSDQHKNLLLKGLYFFKYLLSDALDKKVFSFGDGFIYASKSMQQFYEGRYEQVRLKKKFIIPNLLSKNSCKNQVDNNLQIKLREQLAFSSNDFFFFFAGGYKPTAGVEDLICAFYKLVGFNSNVKLILIGAGGNYDDCKNLVKKLSIENRVFFIEKVPYEQLITYQSLAHVIVCPDRLNPYSELIVHLKYFDSLISGKIVINGSFKSVKEINVDDFLSMSFEPSNQQSLFEVMQLCTERYNDLTEKYSDTREFACSNLTYSDVIKILYN